MAKIGTGSILSIFVMVAMAVAFMAADVSAQEYPEGMMFAVLLMNSAVPLINRWTIPRPLGGPAPKKA